MIVLLKESRYRKQKFWEPLKGQQKTNNAKLTNFKSLKIYAIPYIFSTTLLLYKLDTLLLKQKNLPVLDITGFFFRIRTQVTAETFIKYKILF
jgi:hypothetical protein